MSRTYYWEKTHKKAPGWVTKCEQMQKNHIPLAVLWNPAAELPYCVQYAGNGHYCADIEEVLLWIIGHRPKLIPPEEVIKQVQKEIQEEREKDEREEREIYEMCNETIAGLERSEGHITREGIRDYDKVPYLIVEEAIMLINQYMATLRVDEK